MLAQRLRRLECGMNFITYCSNELYAFLVNGLQYMIFLIVKDKLYTSCYFDNMSIL